MLSIFFFMTIHYSLDQVLTLLLVYLLTYNLSLILFYSVLSWIGTNTSVSLNSLKRLRVDTFDKKALLISLFSMSGVPPFVGFFTKVLVLTLLVQTFFYLLFPSLFILLFSGLYFYIQNCRLLLTTESKLRGSQRYLTLVDTLLTTKITFLMILLGLFLTTGFIFFEDILCHLTWLHC